MCPGASGDVHGLGVALLKMLPTGIREPSVRRSTRGTRAGRGFGPGRMSGPWKHASNEIARCSEFPDIAHENKASLARALPLGKYWAASLRSASTCLAVSGPSSGS